MLYDIMGVLCSRDLMIFSGCFLKVVDVMSREVWLRMVFGVLVYFVSMI